MFFGLFGKKKMEKFKPRLWAFPADKVESLLRIREEFYIQENNVFKRYAYYKALFDAGFDGFGHGRWMFCYGANNGMGGSRNKCFPYPYLQELSEEEDEG